MDKIIDTAENKTNHLNPPGSRRNNQCEKMIEHDIKQVTATPRITAKRSVSFSIDPTTHPTITNKDSKKKGITPSRLICEYVLRMMNGAEISTINSVTLKLATI